ncbi:hypothetical protein B0H14DRAFT_1516128 [Mycena olivaceomarginata]|nr:hypothetical protein B0H14DRAFT_1516128 [Mycena olivaceomarginata]
MRHQPTTAPTAVLAQSRGFPRPLFSTSLPQSHNVHFCLLTHQALTCPRKRCYTSPASQSLPARHSNPLPLNIAPRLHPDLHQAFLKASILSSRTIFNLSSPYVINPFFKHHSSRRSDVLQDLLLPRGPSQPHWYPSTPISFFWGDWAILRKMHSTSVWQHPSRPQVQVFKPILAK